MWKERFGSAACLGLIVLVVAAFNDRVSHSIGGVIEDHPLTRLPTFGDQALQTTRTVTAVIGSYTGDHMPMVIFVGGAVALLGLLLRT